MNNYHKMTRSYLYEGVANEIENMIIRKTLKVGEKLLPETTLAKEFGISRNILREAFKILRERGLIEVKSGDGVYVAAPEINIFKDIFKRFISFENISIKNLYDFRMAIESKAAELASENSDVEEIKKMEEIISDMEKNYVDLDKWAKDELEFHLIIAKASGNPLFYSFLSPISNILLDFFYKGRELKENNSVTEGIEGHKKIVEAIKKRNKNKARETMLKHLERSRVNIYKIK
jgi:GntR family transcriptional regulator, transcriptional repressor for pyruvate dehydrogenase complex